MTPSKAATWTVILVATLAEGTETRAEGCAKVYVVARSGSAPRIDGVLAEGEWPGNRWERSMSFPWRTQPAPPTAFCAVADTRGLAFAFRVADEDVVLLGTESDGEGVVARGDRVEVFFARDPRLEHYYSIEVDPLGRVLDYAARFYRRFDEGWDCHGLEKAGRRRPGGYDVELRVPYDALRAMGLDPSEGAVILTGVFRGEFSSRAGQSPDEGWISWIRPTVQAPDFHVPSAFGCLRIGDGD